MPIAAMAILEICRFEPLVGEDFPIRAHAFEWSRSAAEMRLRAVKPVRSAAVEETWPASSKSCPY